MAITPGSDRPVAAEAPSSRGLKNEREDPKAKLLTQSGELRAIFAFALNSDFEADTPVVLCAQRLFVIP